MNSKKSILRQALLFDIYGELLTDKRRDTMAMYCEEDLSYGEIAEQQGISRQAVLNCIKHCERELEQYEDTLGLVQQHERWSRALRYIAEFRAMIAEERECEIAHVIMLLDNIESVMEG